MFRFKKMMMASLLISRILKNVLKDTFVNYPHPTPYYNGNFDVDWLYCCLLNANFYPDVHYYFLSTLCSVKIYKVCWL